MGSIVASWRTSDHDGGGAPKLKDARWFSFVEIKKVANNFSKTNAIRTRGYGKVFERPKVISINTNTMV